MDTLCYLGLSISIFILYNFISRKKIHQYKNLPPSPLSLPIIGHFYLLKQPIQHCLRNLSHKYGPVFFLRFGSRPVLVLSAPSAIEECFTKNDIIFATKPLFHSQQVLGYNFTGLGNAPYGPLWRNLRRLTALEIFSSKSIQKSTNLRTQEIRLLTKKLFKSSSQGCKRVDMKSFFYMLTFNLTMKMIAGNRCFDGDELDWGIARDKLADFRETFSHTMIMVLGDYFPFLKRFTFFGSGKKIVLKHNKRDSLMQTLIDDYRNDHKSSSFSVKDSETRWTIIDIMLSLQESDPEFYSDDIIKGVIAMMMVGGTHTPVMTMESTVWQLISNPEVFEKAREEIDINVGRSRLLEDEDLSNLPYLHCVINEGLRLSSGPIIPPHESTEDCTIGGYEIPRGTMLVVNTWALHRDPKNWVDPEIFKPERFQGGEKMGFKYMPFGSGRRQCPGIGLSMRLMALTLGTLIQCFEWEKTGEEDTKGVRTYDLRALDAPSVEIIFRPREVLVNALSQL